MQARQGKKTYQMLGKVLSERHPDLANELLATYCNISALDSNLSHIPIYYQQFCDHVRVDPNQYKGKLYVHEKMEIRKLFVSSLLRIYVPQVYLQPKNYIVIPTGFLRHMNEAIQAGVPNLSRTIRQVILDEKVYDEYKIKVDSIVDHILSLKQLRHGKTQFKKNN
jgi:hypothetical protein